MKRKLILFLAVLSLAGSGSLFAWGVGVEGGLPLVGGLPGNNLMLSLKLDGSPLLGIGVGNLDGDPSIGVIADFWLIQEKLGGPLGIFLGPGAYVGIQTGDNSSVSLGGRLPVGLQIFPFNWFELFVEIAPALGVTINDSMSFDWNIQGALGLRFWF